LVLGCRERVPCHYRNYTERWGRRQKIERDRPQPPLSCDIPLTSGSNFDYIVDKQSSTTVFSTAVDLCRCPPIDSPAAISIYPFGPLPTWRSALCAILSCPAWLSSSRC